MSSQFQIQDYHLNCNGILQVLIQHYNAPYNPLIIDDLYIP